MFDTVDSDINQHIMFNPLAKISDEQLKEAVRISTESIQKGSATKSTFEMATACAKELKRRGYELVA